MNKCLKLCALVAAATFLVACASKQEEQQSAEKQAYVRDLVPGYSTEAVAAKPANPAGGVIVRHAKRAIGTPYVLGGTGPGGFDCSGLVKWAYNRVGVELPRTAREQSTVGHKIHKVEDMRAGDIVAFRHPKRGYHTGIYVGDGKFIHSPSKKSHVKINSLSEPYFNSTLLGARRVSMDGSSNLVAQAESKLEAYITQRSQRALASQHTKATTSIKAKQKAIKRNSIAKKKSSKTVIAAKKTSKTVAAKNVKTTKQVASKTAKPAAKQAAKKQASKTVAHHNAKTKVQTNKKAATKTVSMLRQKPAKTAGRARSHS